MLLGCQHRAGIVGITTGNWHACKKPARARTYMQWCDGLSQGVRAECAAQLLRCRCGRSSTSFIEAALISLDGHSPWYGCGFSPNASTTAASCMCGSPQDRRLLALMHSISCHLQMRLRRRQARDHARQRKPSSTSLVTT